MKYHATLLHGERKPAVTVPRRADKRVAKSSHSPRMNLALRQNTEPKMFWKISFFAIFLWAGVAQAQETPPKQPQNPGDLTFNSVESLPQEGTGPVLVGGSEARAVDWPASFYSSAGGSQCSATLVGPRSLLLAAHCVGNGKRSTISFREKAYSGKCTHAEPYKAGTGDESADYALCFLDQPVVGLRYETINRDATRLKVNSELILTGYGCTQVPQGTSNQPSGGNDGIFRVGTARIARLPGELEPNTILVEDDVVICPGDSGGGAYIHLHGSGRRLLASVNSRVWFAKKRSYLSSMTTSNATTFVDAWLSHSENHEATICGFNLSGPNCR
jgi:hypothetical protein